VKELDIVVQSLGLEEQEEENKFEVWILWCMYESRWTSLGYDYNFQLSKCVIGISQQFCSLPKQDHIGCL